MCGFTGILDWNKKNDFESKLYLSLDKIKHRGPDNQSYFIDKEKGVYFGFNRLKILDLSDRSNQPFFDDQKNIVLMFNGEIYNFQEIKKELENDFEFKTSSDTEVLIYAYKKWGISCLEKLEGMFSIVLYDKLEEKIFLIRDRLGIKPLFYGIKNGYIIFSSEIKSILETGLIEKQINLTAIDSYLTFLCTIDNLTPFENILKLRPGELITIALKDKNIKTEYYWDLKLQKNIEDEDKIINNIFSKIDQSIKEQMQADVDFGCFLSGGLDSSINAILMSKHLQKPVKTLTVFFDKEGYDETKYSRLVAEKLQAESFERKIEQKDFWEFLSNFNKINDNLNGDLVCFPLYFLSQMTKDKKIKMIQVGEGADEIFCGYRSFKYFLFIKLIDKIWNYTFNWNINIKKILSFIPKLLVNKNGKIYEMMIHWDNNLPWYFGANNIFNEFEKKNIWKNEVFRNINKDFIPNFIKKYYKKEHSPLQKISYLETKLRLPELLLNRVDMLTMNFSIESRVPFLNSNLVQYVFNIKDELKLKNHTTKYLLKKSMKDAIPNEIIDREKQGFWAPFLEWYINDSEFNKKINDLILNSKLIKLNIFNEIYIKKLLNTKKFNTQTILKIWSILILTNFYDYYFN